MAKVVRGVDSYKKEFLSIFNSLCGRHGRWEVWSDFIQLTAIDISNVTDKGNAPKRAADARNIAKKYSEDEIKRMAEMLMQKMKRSRSDLDANSYTSRSLPSMRIPSW